NTHAVDLIVNGDFETGDLTGWQMTNNGYGTWTINHGTVAPPGPAGVLPPISGGDDALTMQEGPRSHLLGQLVSVPSGFGHARLTWSDRVLNFDGQFFDPVQEWRVTVRGDGTTIELFSTNPGDDPYQLGPNPRSVDLTDVLRPFEGEQVLIAF